MSTFSHCLKTIVTISTFSHCLRTVETISIFCRCLNSFIHIEHLYSASSRELLSRAPDSSTAKKNSLKVRKTFIILLCIIYYIYIVTISTFSEDNRNHDYVFHCLKTIVTIDTFSHCLKTIATI